MFGVSTTDRCEPTSVVINQDNIPPGPIGQGLWADEQLVNAAIIINVGHEMGLSLVEQTVGVMTAMGESSLTVMDSGDTAGPDSRGLFQQRDNGAWGTYEDRMDPARSSEMFFEAMEQVDEDLRNVTDAQSASRLAHTVQINADPYHYEPYWDDAERVVHELADIAITSVTASAQECTPIGEVGMGGDPQISLDCGPVRSEVTDSTCTIYSAMMHEFGDFLQIYGVGCWRDEQGSDHATGRACDYMVAPGGTSPTPQDHQQTVAIVQWLMDNHEALNLYYIIYDEAIWTESRDAHGSWEQVKRADHNYSRRYFLDAGMCDWSDDPQACATTMAHIDHIHVSSY